MKTAKKNFESIKMTKFQLGLVNGGGKGVVELRVSVVESNDEDQGICEEDYDNVRNTLISSTTPA
jgi:hypothetical protein